MLATACSRSKPRVVLYCAQDKEFAEGFLSQFQDRTGLQVDTKYDTEAQKSVSLARELESEARRPRCDVFWNNEILSTIRLEQQGLLEPYASPSAQPFPASAKSAKDTWCAFAARARILIVNTTLVKEAARPQSLLDLIRPEWKGRAAMAKPQYGTSATQAACLFQVLGPDQAKDFYRGLKKNDVHIVPGNKQVAEGVSHGQFALGITDTDDAMIEVEAGRPVTIIFPDRDRPKGDRMGTLFIPNTVAMIHGCRNPDGARRLIDYLLSPEVETQLAQGPSHQIPLNAQVKVRPHPQIETPATVKAMDVDFYEAARLWDEVQQFLRHEFAAP